MGLVSCRPSCKPTPTATPSSALSPCADPSPCSTPPGPASLTPASSIVSCPPHAVRCRSAPLPAGTAATTILRSGNFWACCATNPRARKVPSFGRLRRLRLQHNIAPGLRESPVGRHKPCQHRRDQLCRIDRLAGFCRQDLRKSHEIAMYLRRKLDRAVMPSSSHLSLNSRAISTRALP